MRYIGPYQLAEGQSVDIPLSGDMLYMELVNLTRWYVAVGFSADEQSLDNLPDLIISPSARVRWQGQVQNQISVKPISVLPQRNFSLNKFFVIYDYEPLPDTAILEQMFVEGNVGVIGEVSVSTTNKLINRSDTGPTRVIEIGAQDNPTYFVQADGVTNISDPVTHQTTIIDTLGIRSIKPVTNESIDINTQGIEFRREAVTLTFGKPTSNVNGPYKLVFRNNDGSNNALVYRVGTGTLQYEDYSGQAKAGIKPNGRIFGADPYYANEMTTKGYVDSADSATYNNLTSELTNSYGIATTGVTSITSGGWREIFDTLVINGPQNWSVVLFDDTNKIWNVPSGLYWITGAVGLDGLGSNVSIQVAALNTSGGLLRVLGNVIGTGTARNVWCNFGGYVRLTSGSYLRVGVQVFGATTQGILSGSSNTYCMVMRVAGP